MENNTQIPIYRAKKIDSDEYVIGYLEEETMLYTPPDDTGKDKYEEVDRYYSISSKNGFYYDIIDPSTLSIHFQDMLASDSDRLLPNGEKDLRIFASLSEDGKGGDICENESFPQLKELNGTCIFYKGRYTILKNGVSPKFELLKVIGIQQ